MNTEPVWILHGPTKEPVEAMLHQGLSPLAFVQTERQWSPFRLDRIEQLLAGEAGPAELPQHGHWNWALKAFQLQHPACLGYGVEHGGQMQGLMMVWTAGWTSQVAPDQPLVYVDYLETAPWNAKEFTDAPRYRGIGTRLFQAAVRLSVTAGLAGRVGLHSFPQADDFYRGRCRMTCLGPDPGYHHLTYYELPASLVAEVLQG